MEVFVPWSNETLSSGLDTEKTLVMPAEFKLLYTRLQNGIYSKFDVKLNIKPTTETQVII